MTTRQIKQNHSVTTGQREQTTLRQRQSYTQLGVLAWLLLILLVFPARAVLLQGQVELLPGLNLVGIPLDPAQTPTVASLLLRLGDATTIAAIWRLDPASGLLQRCGYDAGGQPSGEGCTASVSSGEGWLVEAHTATIVPYALDLPCPAPALRKGLNLAAFPCTAAMNSYELLPLLGDDIALAGVQEFDPKTGRWHTATYYNHQPAGDVFPIQPGRAYLVNAREPIMAFRLFGLNFSPYIDGQDPNLGSFVPEEQLLARMQIIRPYTRWIRTFGSTQGLEKSGAIAHNLRLQRLWAPGSVRIWLPMSGKLATSLPRPEPVKRIC